MNTNPDEFNKFHKLLIKDAPDKYEPFYIPIKANAKSPDSSGPWSEKPLSFDEAISRLKQGKNVGIAAMEKDPLVIVDIDDLLKTNIKEIKDTLVIKSRKRIGIHCFYFAGNGGIPNIPTESGGEVRSQNQYVVAPGSFVPCNESDINEIPIEDKINAGKYTIEKINKISTISVEELPNVFQKRHLSKKAQDVKIVFDNPPKIGDGSDHAAVRIATWLRVKGYSKEEAVDELIKWWKRSNQFDSQSENWIGHKINSAFNREEPIPYYFKQSPNEFDIINNKLKPNGTLPAVKPTIDEIIVQEKNDKGEVKNTKVYPGVLGEYISWKYTFKTLEDTEQIYVYSNGVYIPGETLIKHESQKILGSKLVKTHYVTEATDYIKRKTYTDRDLFDRDPQLINLKNGLFDVELNKLTPHTPEYLSFIQLPIEYDEKAKCSLWEKYLIEAVPTDEDRFVLQEVAGWVFVPEYNIHKFILIEGKGGNGKSVYLDTISALMGSDNVSNVPWQELCTDKYAKGKLYGKMANIHSDLPKTTIKDTGTFKGLCGGDVRTWSDVKFSKDGISFYNRAKLIFAANHVPQSEDITDSFFQRIVLMTFPNKFRDTPRDDKHLKDKILKELSGVFNWALIGLYRLRENQNFSTSKTTEEFREMFMKKSNTVFAFHDERVEEGTINDYVTKDIMYQRYVGYCKDVLDVIPIHKQEFGKEFPKNAGHIGAGQVRIKESGEEGKGTPTRCWKGIRLVSHLTIERGVTPPETEPPKEEVSQLSQDVSLLQGDINGVSPGSIKIDSKKEREEKVEENILHLNREKTRDSCDTDNQETRVKALFEMISSREKTFNGSVVYKSELADDYQLKKWTVAQLDEDLQTLMKDGQIYDPNRNERYKIV